ncbi:MAG: hypothetical protein ACOYL8_03100 [Patescibacteria group bacterium]
MKTLKFSCFLAIIFAFISLFSCCDPINPPDPKPDPKDTVAVIDSVIIEAVYTLPTGSVINEAGILVTSSAFTSGYYQKSFYTDSRIFKLIFVSEAKSLIGKECKVEGVVFSGKNSYGRVCNFQELGGGTRTVTIKKGINKVYFEFKEI